MYAIAIGVKSWLAILLLLPTLALAQEELREEPIPEEEAPVDDSMEEYTWVDAAHTATADSAQALVEWMDEFFGDPTYDLEKAESFLRLEFENE